MKVKDNHTGDMVDLSDDCRSCGYQGYEFGAPYPDADCIDGYLWDMDSGDAEGDGWVYTHGGDMPCPHCNHSAWLEGAIESVKDQGANAYCEGATPDDCPYFQGARFAHLAGAFATAWLDGYNEAMKDD